MDKKQLYENIIKRVSDIVKKHLNEFDSFDYDDFDYEENDRGMTFADELAYHFGDEALKDYGYAEYVHDDEECMTLYDIMNELENMGYSEGDTVSSDDLYKAIHKIGYQWEVNEDLPEFEDMFDITVDWEE